MSDNKEIKKDILIAISKKLAEYKFKLTGGTLIRETEPGLYQIIDITLGPSTSSKANNIGLGFGITTEEWINNLNNYKKPKILTGSHCEIKDHNCRLVPSSDETTWYHFSLGLQELF